MTTHRTVLLALVASVAGCDYTGDFLFPDNTAIDDIWVLTGPDGEFLVPADIVEVEDIAANTIYGEVGPSATTEDGGVTVDFVGTGGPVCIWVDPEVAFWNQAVFNRLDPELKKWSYPDNVYDDGDIDMFAGLSVYYTGSPGETVGDFVVAYEDSLGNEVPISLAACPNEVGVIGDPAAAGRGSPEFCTIPATDLGIGYTILLKTFSTPLDDSRLSFGFILANGSCDDLRVAAGAGGGVVSKDECVIQGEALTPVGSEVGPYFGFDEVNDAGRVWERSIDFESQFCDPDARLDRFCSGELQDRVDASELCVRQTPPDDQSRCYCGDLNDTPEGGAL